MNFIINMIEDIILVYFIANYISISQKQKFIISMFSLCLIETCLFDIAHILSWLLPIVITITLLGGILHFNKKISYNDIICCCLGLSLIVISNLFSLFIISLYTNINLNKINTMSLYFKLSVIISKLIFFCLMLGVLFISKKVKSFLYLKDWWMLIPIWILLFGILFIVGYSIVYNILNIYTIYSLLLLLITLSILILLLYLQIQKKNKEKQKIELEVQKSYYVQKNKEMINQLYNEITVIDHYNMYVLLHTKTLIQNKQYKEADTFLDKNIHKLKRYKNVINTGHPFFDYEMNKLINNLILSDGNIKTSIGHITMEIGKEHLELINDVISQLFSFSNKNKVFSIDISEIYNYITISVSFYSQNSQKIDIPSNTKKMLKQNLVDYTFHKTSNIYVFKFILEVKK